MLQTQTFYAAILRSLASEGLPDRVILRSFPPVETCEAHEVLIVAHKRYAETIYVDHKGALIHGPIPGFGAQDT